MFKRFVMAQGFLLKKAWGFSRLLFLGKMMVALVAGITPTLLVLLERQFVEQLTQKQWPQALIYIGAITLATILSAVFVGFLNSKLHTGEEQLSGQLLFGIKQKTAEMDLKLLNAPTISTLRERAEKTAANSQQIIQNIDIFFK
nr:hypothetical protein [bacterium]